MKKTFRRRWKGTDIKAWLEQTGLKVAQNAFTGPVRLPFLVFLDDAEVRGADNINLLCGHTVTLELYSGGPGRQAERKIERLLNGRGFAYTRERIWVDGERCFETVYTFEFTERLEE